MAEQIRLIQQIELDLLKEFTRICRKYQLKYFAIGGTCIGAVRHEGFIPWDDDIDIVMPFRDYKRFQSIAKKELPNGISLFTPQKRRHWYGNFIKIHNENTTFVESSHAKFADAFSGVYMDIMPAYGMPKGKVLQYLVSMICDWLIFLNRVQRQPYCDLDSVFQKAVWHFNIPVRKTQSFNYYLEVLEKIFKRYPFDNSDKIIFGFRKRPSRFHKNYTYQNVFNYEDFKEITELPFEDSSIAVPCGYKNYLTADFGDYMKLPPKEQRRPRHETVLIDLNKSYKEYMKEGISK